MNAPALQPLTPTEPVRSGAGRLTAFEGLRGVAAMMVVFSHLQLAFFAQAPQSLRESVSFMPRPLASIATAGIEWVRDGHFAVWVFWVMSAFVLSLRFFQLAQGDDRTAARRYLKGASLRRYPRLVIPIIAAVLLGYCLFSAGLMRNQQAAPLAGSDWLARLYTFDPSLLRALKEAFFDVFYVYEPAKSYNVVLWTMKAELIGSLFVFAVLGIVGHRRYRWAVYAVTGIVLLLLQLDYLNGFLAGLILCDIYVRPESVLHRLPLYVVKRIHGLRTGRVVSYTLLAIVLVLVGLPKDRQLPTILLSILLCAMTLFLLPLNRLLSTPVPVFLGRVSFGLYLVHVPIISSFSCAAYVWLRGYTDAMTRGVAVSVATIFLSLMAGYAFYRLVDAPAVRISKVLTKRAPATTSPGGRESALHPGISAE
ncbi:MAG: acyltransferase [Burkholderiales bacterium]|nr:acyltransferase [Phycisphaerae bacterium]